MSAGQQNRISEYLGEPLLAASQSKSSARQMTADFTKSSSTVTATRLSDEDASTGVVFQPTLFLLGDSQDIVEIKKMVSTLSGEVEALRTAIASLTTQISGKPDEQDAETRNISIEEAEGEILQLFRDHRGADLYYSDIAETLNLDFATVIEACKRLQATGTIQGVAE